MRISFKRNGFIALASMLSFAVYAGDNLPLATAASGTNGSIQVSEHGVDTSNEIQQARVIQGTVLEEGTNEPLIGVNVVVKGTTIGTTTDVEGKYSIRIPSDNAVLVFSYIGQKTEEYSVKGLKSLDVIMKSDATMLSEVVVYTGYMTQKKADLTGSVALADSKDIKKTSANVMKAMQGKMAGVKISNNGGNPAEDIGIQIRGLSSLSGAVTPLIVLDGMPAEGLNLRDINSGDIESIQVLKDAASASIYGARASGGVILVQTKKGKAGKTTIDWNVGGTDLGIIWEMQPGKYGIFFGDTFGYDFKPNPANPGPNGGSWRSNVLAFSEDNDLEDGLSFSNMATDDKGYAREIVYGGKDSSGNGDWTSIPTAAIRANGIDYVHYFNMRNWTGWITNYSGIYKSVDNGLTWAKCKDITFSSYSFFGQVGYFKKDGYVYMIGTQTGRDSNAKLARFHETDIENKTAYEYWNAFTNQWIKGNENEATVLIEDKVGELSFIYNETHKKWIIAYFNADRYNITMRTAEDITGPWSEPYELANGREYAQLYGSYIHPLSVTGDNLYFTMSMWMPYNVFLMKAELADMGEF